MTMNRNTEQIIIIQGSFKNYVQFRDLMCVKANLSSASGRCYFNLTMSSWKRLLKVMSNPEIMQIELEPDDLGVIIVGWHLFPRQVYSL